MGLSRSSLAGGLIGSVCLSVFLTWPLLPRFTSHVAAAPDQEAATHIWGLWAAGATASPLHIETALQGFPGSVELVLVDPLNLLPYQLGAIWGPAAGYNTVLLAGVLLMGLAGALLTRELGGRPWVGAFAAMCCPTLLANAADGMTEGFGVGIVGVFVALAIAAIRRPNAIRIALAGLTLGATAWAGPYNAVWAAILGLSLTARCVVKRRPGQVCTTLSIGGLGLLVAAPVIWSIFQHRDEGLPGGSGRAGLPDIVENPEIFRGGVQTGADLLDPFLPVQLTGSEADVSHTAYLGIVLLLAAIRVAYRHPRSRPLLAAGLVFSILSLGPWLHVGGSVLRWAGDPVAAPAGMLTLAIPIFGRLTRWYRAGAVATLLLAPVAARLPKTPAHAIVLCTALLFDSLVLAPLAWPLHTSPLPSTAELAALPSPGALLELPPVTSGPPPPGAWRDLSALSQVLHGRPIGGSMMGLGVSQPARDGTTAIRVLLRDGTLASSAHDAMRDSGFRYLVIHLQHHPIPPRGREHLTRCLGAPIVATNTLRVHDLGSHDTPAGCPSRKSTESEL